MPDASGDWTAQSGGDKSLGNSAEAIGTRPIRFTERNAIALDVLNHSRRNNLGGKVDDGTDHAMRCDGGGDDAAGIDTLQPQAFPFPAEALKIPPGNSVLRTNDRGIGPQNRLQVRCELRQAVRLSRRERQRLRDLLHRGNWRILGRATKSPSLLFYLHAIFLHGAKVRATREEV